MANFNIIQLLEFLTELEEKSDSKEAEKIAKRYLEDFKCKRNKDVENFLHNLSIRYERENKARTYLITDEELEIVAYFSIGVKPILIDEKKHVLSKQQKKDMKLEVINKEDKRHEVISTFLIGQIARNDKFDKSTIGLEEILGQVFNKINEVVKIIGGKIILIEVDNNPILVKHYEKFGFKIIKDGSNDELTQLMKFNGR